MKTSSRLEVELLWHSSGALVPVKSNFRVRCVASV